jgi:hypothetical protein
MANKRTYALWEGTNMAASTTDATEALDWMVQSGKGDADPHIALIVFDGDGMTEIALVDARTQNA